MEQGGKWAKGKTLNQNSLNLKGTPKQFDSGGEIKI